MKKRFLAIFVILLLLLASCRVEISLDGVKVTSYKFFASNNYEELLIESSDSVGLTAESGETTLNVAKNLKIRYRGILRNFNYKGTVLSNKNAAEEFDVFNRAYNVYHYMNTVEYWLLCSTGTVCGYRKTDIDESKNENLSSIGFKACSDEFLYNVMASTWRQEYTRFEFLMPSDKNPRYTAFYIKEYEGYATDDVLKIEVTQSGEVSLFEAFGMGKYDYLQNTVLKSDIDKSAEELQKFLVKNGLDTYNCSEFCIVTDTEGGVYLKTDITDQSGEYYDTIFVNIAVPKVEMSEEYEAMVAGNYKNNKALDMADETTTKNRIINDQNGSTISKFRYGRFSASYNACGAIAVHNAKVLLNKESTLSQTIYDIETGYGLTLGGAFGSDDGLVPEMMKKYGIKCVSVSADEIYTRGIYILSFWHQDPPWNGTHTITVKSQNGICNAYNLLGDGTAKPIDIESLKGRIISCYRVG